MGRSKRLLIALLLIHLPPINAAEIKNRDCGCVIAGSAKEAFQKADVVFVGIPVIGKLQEKMLAEVEGERIVDGRVDVKFRILKAWKGVTTNYIWVSSQADEANCGYSFYLARPYLVYAHGKHTLETSRCDRNALEREASRDLKELGEANKVFNAEVEEDE